MKARDILYLPITPVNILIGIIINILILKNTPQEKLLSLTEDEYVKMALEKIEELYYKPLKPVLITVSVVLWFKIIIWI